MTRSTYLKNKHKKPINLPKKREIHHLDFMDLQNEHRKIMLNEEKEEKKLVYDTKINK